MTTIDELEQQLASQHPSLPSDTYSLVEKILLWATLFTFAGLASGLVLANQTVWVEGLKPIIWDPILEDAGAAGDADYNSMNTAIYTFSMLACVVVLQALFRKANLPADDKMLIALTSWVCLAPVLRVLEDADFFNSDMDWLFISPIIHLHLAAWLVVVGGVSKYLAQRWNGDDSDRAEIMVRKSLLPILSLLLFFHWAYLYQPAYSSHETMGMPWVYVGLFASFGVLFGVVFKTRGWPAISRSLLAFGSAASVLGVGHWIQFLSTPWAQESSRVSESIAIWPIFVVLGIPALVCYVMYKQGIDDARHIRLTGYEAGVLPEGISIKAWEKAGSELEHHPVEMLSRKALLASPMVLVMVFGQLCDGFATMVGIDFFGYGEKHVVSNQVIVYGGQINDALGVSLGEGAWLFVVLKTVLIAAITWMFVEMKVENRQRHIRILIVLAVMIVGLAPGLRDIGRLMLGV
ncbi:MAG: hypothetical protein CMA63_01240 [Euryarchaeota archaeon]|nr:hypothetical protein [Euryarchaeota archaeon]|tara:strand:+ start:35701 stop:37089 length:1389 start_codon:yes stop_codon:yes gene_type:complete